MGRLGIAMVECNYEKLDRQVKEQYIHGLNDNEMLTEIICELTTLTDIGTVTSEQIVTWAR